MDNALLINEEKVTEWLKTIVLPKVCKIIGKSCENVNISIKLPENCFFLASVQFVSVEFPSGESIQLVIKKPATDQTLVSMMHAKEQFHNEILFFEEFAKNNKRFPRCFYTLEDDDLKNSAIVTENIESLGFKMCLQSYNIPLDYTISGLREMARFHGMGYVMKTREPEKFKKIIDSLREYRYFCGEWLEILTNTTASRPITYLKKKNYDPHFCDIMEKHLNNAFETVLLDAVKPCEPLAVLCHGDFTRNNIFYRESENGLDTMLIDFAMLRYSAPSIDISTFLYLSCSPNDLFEKFDILFDAYHTTLINYLREEGITKLDQYSYDHFLADYRRRELFGFVIAVFFKPMQHGFVTVADIDYNDIKKSGLISREAGGDELSQELAEILIKMRENGGLDHIIR